MEVSIIIVNYNGRDYIKDLLLSIHNQVFNSLEVIFIDNNSSDGSVEHLRELHEQLVPNMQLKIKSLEINTGFAKANNIAVNMAQGKYLLFLNTDALMQTSSLKQMLKDIKKEKKTAGVAPKIYLSKFQPINIFDSIGICINGDVSPYNRGIGQIDLGQYDRREEVLGLCFACCLVKRDVFLKIGGLDEDYFAYFEDVDWSIRARKSGYKFYSSPKAIIYHDHSGTTSKKKYAWKYFLIFRNYLRTVQKDINLRHAIKVILKKLRELFASAIRPTSQQYRSAMMKVILNYLIIDFWRYLPKRMEVQSTFTPYVKDEYLFKFSEGEPSTLFDPVGYKPIITLEAFDLTIHRKESRDIVKKWNRIKRSYYTDLTKSKWKPIFNKFLKRNFNKYYSNELVEFITHEFDVSTETKKRI